MGLEQAICALSAWTKDCNMSVCLLNLTHSSSLPPNTLINQTATSQVEKSSLKRRGGSKKRRRYDSDPPHTRAAICFKSALTEHNKDASIQCAAPQRERKWQTLRHFILYTTIIAKAFICKGGKYLEVVCILGPFTLRGTFIMCSSHAGSSLVIPQPGVSCISFVLEINRFYAF